MAEMGYGCVFGDCTSQVAHIITDISNGATVSLCGEHYAPGLIPLLAAELGVDPGDFYANIERYLARQAKKAEAELAKVQAAAEAGGEDGHQGSGEDGHQGDDLEPATVDDMNAGVPASGGDAP